MKANSKQKTHSSSPKPQNSSVRCKELRHFYPSILQGINNQHTQLIQNDAVQVRKTRMFSKTIIELCRAATEEEFREHLGKVFMLSLVMNKHIQ